MTFDRTLRWRTTAAASFLAALCIAGEGIASGRATAAIPNPTWQAECGTCHIAYPPRLLPAGSWRSLMDGLGRHFGTDASVDAATAAEIRAFLDANAGRSRGTVDDSTLRITETRWFVRKHRGVSAAVWRSADVRSAANCAACHVGAEAGRFSEHDLRVPHRTSGFH